MAALVLAFSISDRIEKYGAICGYAAILGLAVLSLLYFAQAREVKRLREWAGRAPERDADLQQRVIADAQRRAQVQPGTVAAQRPPAAAPVTPGAAAARPGNGGGTPPATAPGAPGAPAATPGTAAKPGEAKPDAAKPADAKPGDAKPATDAKPGAAKPTTPPAAAPGAPAPGPAKPAAPAAAPTSSSAPTSAPATAAGGAAAGAAAAGGAAAAAGAARPRRTVAVGGPRPATASVPQQQPPSRAGGGGLSGVGEHRPGRATVLIALGAIAAAAIIVLLVSGVIGGGDSSPKTTGNKVAPAQAGSPAAGTATPSRGDTIVTVLNGTTVTGLARTAADKLQSRGYKVDRVTDAADQAQQASAVAYADGYRKPALDIARIVGIPASAVAPIDASTRAVAGDAAQVVVTMGADKAQ
jgi:hypothetical protein